MRRKTSAIAATVLCLLSFSACSSQADPEAEPATPTRTPSSAPTAAPTATTTAPAPSPTVDPEDPSTWELTDHGAGPYVLGMPFADAVTAAMELEDACGHAYVKRFAPSHEFWIWGVYGTLDYIFSSVPGGPRTKEGIGVGSTTADVLAAYPDALVDPINLTYLRHGNMFFGYHSDVLYGHWGATYRDDDGVPEEIVVVGVTARDILPEFCA